MSVHINAKKGEIAKTVLMPGDPLRAKWIAEEFLDDVICYNNVRGMLGYTEKYQGNKISVQGSGMGVPSALIYYHELITEYGVETIIRVGTAGAYQRSLELRDVVLAMSASTTSAINNSQFYGAQYAPTANFELFKNALQYAEANNIVLKTGNVLTNDVFYEDDPDSYKKWAAHGVLCVEMETAGLYTIAAKHKVRALSVLTISDSLVTGATTSAVERETSFKKMVEIALKITQPSKPAPQ